MSTESPSSTISNLNATFVFSKAVLMFSSLTGKPDSDKTFNAIYAVSAFAGWYAPFMLSLKCVLSSERLLFFKISNSR